MKAFKNILLIQPFNNQTLARVKSLLQSSQAKVTLFDVVPEIGNPKINSETGKIIDLQKLLVEEHQGELDRLAEPLLEDGFRAHTRVATGHAFIETIRQVIKKKHDLVIMNADGVSGIREQIFGTTSLHLMRKCPCPVWVVKPTRRKKLRKVLAAVDPDPEDETRNQLNLEILNRASSIAHLDNAKLHVVHAWNTFGGDVNRSRRWLKKAEIRLYIEQVASEHRKRLNSLLETNVKQHANIHMIQGRPGEVIPGIVDRENIDLLVMGTVCRTGIPGFFIGNTAEMILSQVDCSVLTVKPEGFDSPVKVSS